MILKSKDDSQIKDDLQIRDDSNLDSNRSENWFAYHESEIFDSRQALQTTVF